MRRVGVSVRDCEAIRPAFLHDGLFYENVASAGYPTRAEPVQPPRLQSAAATLDALVAGCLTPLRFGNRFKQPCRRQEALSTATAPLR